jgi:hypothetical protein
LTTVSDDRLKCHACGRVHLGAHLVTLHDDRQVGSYSEEWRLECEAKMVTRLPTLEKRRKYLEAVQEKRGVKAWNDLQDRILSIWKTSKHAQPQVARNSGRSVVDTPATERTGRPEQTAIFF